jgi:hypothetical protein
MMYKVFAWISVVLLFYNFSLFPLRRILRRYKGAQKFLVFGSKLHRFTGVLLLITGAIHGYLALGTIALHTGSLLWSGVLLLFIYYLLRKQLKRRWLILHRFTDFIVVGWFFVHFFFPWLL